MTKLLLDRLREEQAVNTSAWMRKLIQRELEQVFPDFADYVAAKGLETPGADDETQRTDGQNQRTRRSRGSGRTTTKKRTVQGHSMTTKAPENPRRDTDEVTPEQDPQKTPIVGWKPRKLPSGDWAAALTGAGVAELPDDDELRGTPIVVTDKQGESWTTTVVRVVERSDDEIIVENSGRSRS